MAKKEKLNGSTDLLAQAMQHEPRRFLRHLQIAMEFHR